MDESHIVEFNVTEIFDLSDKFQSRIVNVCTARNDLVRLLTMMNIADKMCDDDSTVGRNNMLLFLSKFNISVIRETHKLIKELFNTDRIKEIMSGNQQLVCYYEKYVSVNPLSIDSGEFKFLKSVRDSTFHYSEPKYQDIKDCPLLGIISFSDRELSYQYTDSVYYLLITNEWRKYHNLPETEDAFENFVKWFREVVVAAIHLLDAVFTGYYETYLSLEEKNGTYTLVRKDKASVEN